MAADDKKSPYHRDHTRLTPPKAMPVVKPDEHMTPVEGVPIMTTEETVRSTETRSREIKNTSVTTLQLFQLHKDKTEQEFKVVHGKIDDLKAKQERNTEAVTKTNEVLSDVRVDLARQEGQNDRILEGLDDLKDERKHRREITTKEKITELETHTARQISEAEIEKEEKLTALASKKADTAIRTAKWSAIWAWIGKGSAVVAVVVAAIAGWAKC